VVFKGSGFYVTDSRAKAKASSENGASTSNGSSTDSPTSKNGADKAPVSSDSKSD
jgi:hypothetical protein